MVLEQMKWAVIINKFEKVKISICEFGLLFWSGTWSFGILREHEKLDIMCEEWEGQIFYMTEFFIGEPLQTVFR